jgi:hypothetical protein
MAPAVGFEPTTNRLTADRSTTELRWNRFSVNWRVNFAQAAANGKPALAPGSAVAGL